MALEVSLVRDSRWLSEDDDVMSGVRVRSVRWRERVGCCEGRFDIVGERRWRTLFVLLVWLFASGFSLCLLSLIFYARRYSNRKIYKCFFFPSSKRQNPASGMANSAA